MYALLKTRWGRRYCLTIKRIEIRREPTLPIYDL